MNIISVNIWDDYHGDNFSNESGIDDTYMYIETVIDYQYQREILNSIVSLAKSIIPQAKFELHFNDTTLKYPHFLGTENERLLFKRWQINIKNLSHTNREILVKKLNSLDLYYYEENIKFYSES